MTLKREATSSETVNTSISCQQQSTSTTAGKPSSYGTWTPPKCWWEQVTLDEFIHGYGQLNALIHHTGEDTSDWAQQFRAYYMNTHSSDTTGNWYQVYCEPDATDAERAATGWDQIPGDWQWIPNGKPSTVGTAPTVNNATLADIAAGQMTIPPTKLSMSPDATGPNPIAQTVNLPTYFWLDPKQFAKEQITAQLPQFNLAATVTAVPEEMDISIPGAVFATGNGGNAGSTLVCLAKADGTIGTRYSSGTASNCSVTFLQPTPPNTTFTIQVTVKWRLDWTAAAPGSGWPRELDMTQNVPNITVREIESANG
jgi:enoyl reductase